MYPSTVVPHNSANVVTRYTITNVARLDSTPATSARVCRRTTVTSGTRTISRRARASWNTGVSVIVSRTYRPTSTSAALARNGSRHPHAKNCASVVQCDSTRNTAPDVNSPTGAPSCGNIPYHARVFAVAFSTASSSAPPHSPPSPIPCPNRQAASITGAATPIDL